MNNTIFTKPSFYAHILSSVILLLILLLLLNNFSVMQKSFTLYEKLMTLMVLSLVIAVHGLSHLGLENSYKFLI